MEQVLEPGINMRWQGAPTQTADKSVAYSCRNSACVPSIFNSIASLVRLTHTDELVES